MTMDEIEINNLYSWAWKQWGADTQIDMLIEEMSELTQALLKSRRNGVVFSHAVTEEFADVEICMDQIKKKMIEAGNGTPLNVMREKKLERLKNRLIADAEEKEGLADPIMGLSR
jgi:NTP pyrophosphatase (non-canonical NTP hydrolase)